METIREDSVLTIRNVSALFTRAQSRSLGCIAYMEAFTLVGAFGRTFLLKLNGYTF